MSNPGSKVNLAALEALCTCSTEEVPPIYDNSVWNLLGIPTVESGRLVKEAGRWGSCMRAVVAAGKPLLFLLFRFVTVS